MTCATKCRILTVRDGWAICPVCGRQTFVKILDTTRLENFPLYCKKCKRETLVTYPEPEPCA